MELCVLKLECKFESNLWARSVGSWQWGGNTTGSLHICRAHPREAQRAANTKVFITLHPLLFVVQDREKKKKSPPPSEADQSTMRIRKQTFKENGMPPLIGRTALVPLHSPPIDTWEISSRQLLILVIYNRRGSAATDDFLSCWSRLTTATRTSTPRAETSTNIPLIKPAPNLPNCPFSLLIISYITWASYFWLGDIQPVRWLIGRGQSVARRERGVIRRRG